MMSQGSSEDVSQPSMLLFSADRYWRVKRRALFWPAFLPLILLSGLLLNWAALIPTAFAMPQVGTSAQGHLTFQQFLQEGQQSKAPHGAFVFPNAAQSQSKTAHTATTPTKPLPSAEPPTMQPLSLALTSTQTSQAMVRAAGVQPVDLKGNDGRLEVLVPSGALDLSKATTAQGQAATGPFTLKVTHLHGNFIAAMNMLGSYQFQVLDASGQPVQGVMLRQPMTLVYHYQVKEVQRLQLDPDHLYVSWPEALAAARNAKASTQGLVVPMTNNAKQHTLSAQLSVIPMGSTSTGTSFPIDESPPRPNFASVQGNSGNLGYRYPIQMAPGPDGFTPALQFSYTSSVSNSQHNPVQPAGDEGEGWSVGLGSITSGPLGYAISGVDGVSDLLIPIPGQAGFYETQHISHLRIQATNGCFFVWDTSGNYSQLGCTSDSLQYYTNSLGRTNYRWDTNLEASVTQNSTSPDKEIVAHYLQDMATVNGFTSVRDASLQQVVYGTVPSYGGSLTAVGTVDFLYRAPFTSTSMDGLGDTWATAYTTNYQCDTSTYQLPTSTTMRCDDPIADGSVQPPPVMSTMMLQTVKTFVGDDSSTSHLDASDALTYDVLPFQNCNDPEFGSAEYCANNIMLTSITPTAYLQGTPHPLHPVSFGYTLQENLYIDPSQTVWSGAPYQVQTVWEYLNSYFDANSGVGEKITYTTAWNNTNGTPNAPNGDDRHNPLYCTIHVSDGNACSGTYANPDTKAWSVQVVTQIQNWGTDSSTSTLHAAITTYNYQMSITGTTCPAAGSDTDCVGYTWLPGGDSNWVAYYDGQFQGFAAVYTTSPSGDLTVDHYYGNAGWTSATTNPVNSLSGQLLDEEVYSGNSTTGPLLQQVTNTYAGESGTNTPIACDTSVTGTYVPCETVLLSTQKILTEEVTGGLASQSPTPGILDLYSYDDYNPSASGTGLQTGSGHYHNMTQDQVQIKVATTHCSPCMTSYPFVTQLTRKWTYQTNDQAVNGWTYYDVNKASESEIDDPSGHIWNCQTVKYDEGAPSGVPIPAEGLATTVNTYSSANCASQTSPLTTTYTGYDGFGNQVVTVDAVGAANSSLYTGKGCTGYSVPGSPPHSVLITPTFFTAGWTGGYTTCTGYDASSQPIAQVNAFGQVTQTTYDTTQQDLPVNVTDPNGQVTTGAYSYDSNGNQTTQVKQPLETGSYSNQSTARSTCTTSTTFPCIEEDTNSSLYSGAVSRTFYDTQGRAVETRTPGPTPGDDTVVMTVYNDQLHTVWQSVPFQVADGASWIDPNGAKDINGVAPSGSVTFLDALGRAIARQDPNFGSSQEPGIACSTTLTGTYTSCVNYSVNTGHDLATSVDPNMHVQTAFSDLLGRTVETQTETGVYNGVLFPAKQTTISYNALNKPVSVAVVDEQPQSGESPVGVTTTMTYDDLGRLLTVTDPDQGTFSSGYDPDGRVIATTQTSGSSSRTVGVNYDLLGRPGCEQTAAPTINATGACSAGNPLVQNTYDATVLGTKGSTDFPVGQLTQTVADTYYPDGTAASVTQQFQHDQRGRVLNTQMQLGLPSGWNVSGSLPTYQESMFYNDANQVTTVSTLAGSSGYTFSPIYDPTNGSLTGLSNNSTTTANLATLSYNENAQLAGITLLNGAASSPASFVSEAFSYDGNLRPTSLTATWLPPSGQSGQVLSQGRGYDNAGNVTSSGTTFAAVPSQSGSGGTETQNFCYDEQNRLVWSGNGGTMPAAGNGTCGSGTLASGMTGAGYTAPFSYTNLGQIWQGPSNGTGSTQQYLYCNSAPHQLSGIYPTGTTCANKGSATASYSASYDPYGNETSRTFNNVTAILSYDTLNHLVEWSAGSSGQEFYVYDASGQRVLKRSTSGSTTSLTTYPFGLEEYGYGGSGGTPTSQWHFYSLAGHLIGSTNGSSTTYDLTDAQGSVLMSLSASAIQGEQLYGPYGNQRYTAGTIGTDKGYTGQFHDALTGLDYYNARFYDPVSGQFLSPDSVQGNAQGMDPYTYVAGNPETRTDPTGNRVACPSPDGCGGSGPPNQNDCAADPTLSGCPGSGGGGGGTKTGVHPCVTGCANKGAGCQRGFEPSDGECVHSDGPCKYLTDKDCKFEQAQAKKDAYKDAQDAKSHFQWVANLLSGIGNLWWLGLIFGGEIITGILAALNRIAALAQDLANWFGDEVKKGVDWFTTANVVSAGEAIKTKANNEVWDTLSDIAVIAAGGAFFALLGAVSGVGAAVGISIVVGSLTTAGIYLLGTQYLLSDAIPDVQKEESDSDWGLPFLPATGPGYM